MRLSKTLTLFFCAAIPGTSRGADQPDLRAALRCAPAQIQSPNRAPTLIMRCGQANHPLEPVENLFFEVEVLEVSRMGTDWVAHVRRSSSVGEVVFRYRLDDTGRISERACLPSIPPTGTPVALAEGHTRFTDWCASVAPPCRSPAEGAFQTVVHFEVEHGRLVRPKRKRIAVDDLAPPPEDTCAFETQVMPVAPDAKVEPAGDVRRTPDGRLRVPRGSHRVRVDGLPVSVGGPRPKLLTLQRSATAGRAWTALRHKLTERPKTRLGWTPRHFTLVEGTTRALFRARADGTLEQICRYAIQLGADAADEPRGSDCRDW